MAYLRFSDLFGEANPKVHIPFHERYKRLCIAITTGIVKSGAGRLLIPECHAAQRIIIPLVILQERPASIAYKHETSMNKGTLSSHLSKVEEAGYVELTKTYRGKAPQTLLQLTSAGRRSFNKYRGALKSIASGK